MFYYANTELNFQYLSVYIKSFDTNLLFYLPNQRTLYTIIYFMSKDTYPINSISGPKLRISL